MGLPPPRAPGSLADVMRRGQRRCVVTRNGAGSGSVSERFVPDPSQRTAEDLLTVIKETLGEEPPVLVQPRVKQGRPAKVLIEESANASLLVVGKRGHGGFAGLVLGSVSQHVAAYAKCPVAVVR